MVSKEILQPNFDLYRYMGKWYEIFKFPTLFQSKCARSTAEYIQVQDETLKMETKSLRIAEPKITIFTLVECFDNNDKLVYHYKGEVRVVNPEYPAALEVGFHVSADPLRFTGTPNYLIHETDYDNYAIVGSLDRRSLFVLARKQSIDLELFKMLIDRVRILGYSTNNLILDNGAIIGMQLPQSSNLSADNWTTLYFLVLIIIIVLIFTNR